MCFQQITIFDNAMKSDKFILSHSYKNEYLILLIILGAGTILRFWNYTNIPFMHDELSALSRLQFDNFSDLIRNGVMLGDTHPAGVQVLLYYWISIVGTCEILVKLPFIISGIISIWVSYLIGKLWFDGTTGLLTAAYVASTQFFILYSQIARPYVSGLLITLLMVYFWSLYFFQKKRKLYLILYVLFSAMASYNHHFSLLFAAIVGLSGLFLFKKKDVLLYIIAGIAIFVLYIPHLHIFMSQLSQGGIGSWLAKPTPYFFFNFLNWIFQFSVWTWLVLIATIAYINIIGGNISSFNKQKKKRWILVIWFLLPIVIGFTYSVLRNPVIQYSMLIFSTPYLFILLFSFHKKITVKKRTVLLGLILLVNILSLVYGRDYYTNFYKQPYQELFKVALVDNKANDVFIIDDCIPYYNEYYFDKYEKVAPYFTKRNSDIDLSGFINMVGSIEQDVVVTHALTGEELQIVQSYFPYQIGYRYGFTHEIYTFSREKPKDSNINDRQLIAQTDFKNEKGMWKDVSRMINYDSTTGSSQCRMKGDEWGPSISFDLNKLAPDGIGIIDVELEVLFPDSISTTFTVASIIEDNETIYYKSLNFESFNFTKGTWQNVFLTVDIQGALKSRTTTNGLTLKINVWNLNKTNIFIDYINIYSKPGNPLRYCLYR